MSLYAIRYCSQLIVMIMILMNTFINFTELKSFCLTGTLVFVAAVLGLVTSCFQPKQHEESCDDTIPIMLSYHHTEL